MVSSAIERAPISCACILIAPGFRATRRSIAVIAKEDAQATSIILMMHASPKMGQQYHQRDREEDRQQQCPDPDLDVQLNRCSSSQEFSLCLPGPLRCSSGPDSGPYSAGSIGPASSPRCP